MQECKTAQVRNQIDLPQEYWDAFHLGMRQVVENKKYFSDLAVNAAGKTGTAEQTASRPNHALFICRLYAPFVRRLSLMVHLFLQLLFPGLYHDRRLPELSVFHLLPGVCG